MVSASVSAIIAPVSPPSTPPAPRAPKLSLPERPGVFVPQAPEKLLMPAGIPQSRTHFEIDIVA